MVSVSTSTSVVISGVSRGLGAALARRFAALGHPVAGRGRDRDREALDRLRADLGEGHLITVTDVTDADAVERWAGETVRRLGAPALVVANAGYISPPGPGCGRPARQTSAPPSMSTSSASTHPRTNARPPAAASRRSARLRTGSKGHGSRRVHPGRAAGPTPQGPVSVLRAARPLTEHYSDLVRVALMEARPAGLHTRQLVAATRLTKWQVTRGIRHLRDVGAAEHLTPIIWHRRHGYMFPGAPRTGSSTRRSSSSRSSAASPG
ncbi:SDR family oxidoreductase [Streptomyces sp. OE57]|uniref:SDR family oxidoreductase n=1 Tax=Streptomyces lacaronensis TaxID=3379885 RepID=UPI0039B77F37